MQTRKPRQDALKRTRPVRSSRVKLSVFARRLLEGWHDLQLPSTDSTIVVAVSGGADSTALLLALDELISKGKLQTNLIVAHLDHALRKESKAEAQWVMELARQLGHETAVGRINVGKLAKLTRDNLEQAGRSARYDFLLKTAQTSKAQLIVTAHTMDDQAETILLRLLRGAGTDGLAGIESVRPLVTQPVSLRRGLKGGAATQTNSLRYKAVPPPTSDLLLARPLLTWARRSETEDYCHLRKVDYLSDPMNQDENFARVRVRKQLLPLMASFNGKIVDALARTAELLRDDLAALNQQADLLLLEAEAENKSETNIPSLSVRVLAHAPSAVRRRALRKWISEGRGDLRRIELLHIVGIEKLLLGDKGGRVAELPGGVNVVRKQKRLELVVKRR